MKTATLVKPKRLSDCNDVESEIDLFSYSEICKSYAALSKTAKTAKFTSSILHLASFINHLYSIKKLTKSKPAIKFKSFKDNNKSSLTGRRRLHGF